MMRLLPLLAVLLCLSWTGGWTGSAVAAERPVLVTAALLPGGTVAPGGTVTVAVTFDIAPGWHLYWTNPGDSGMPPTLKWTLPAGWTADKPRLPVPERTVTSSLVSFAYHGHIALLSDLHAPTGAALGDVPLEVKASWLVCQEACIPGSTKLTTTLQVTPVAAGLPAAAGELTAATARLPVPADAAGITAHATLAEGAVLLSIAKSGLPAPHEAQPFLPLAEGVFALDAKQVASADGTGWHLRLPLAGGASSPPRLAGILTGIPGVAGVALDLAIEPAAGGAPATGTAPTTGASGAPELPPAAGGAPGASTSTPAPPISQSTSISLPGALLAGLVGGLLLNLMPCVLPVLALKALSFGKARAAGKPLLGEALGHAAGVICTFLALAGLLLGARAAGLQLGWGFQLQEPGVVVALVGLFVLLTANLAGLFEIGLAATRVDTRRGGPFLNGVLTTVVATPCGAPFASAALGFAAVAPAPQALAVFLALGVGLAAPLVLAALVPATAKLLPKPGPWMEDLRKVLALPMLGTAGWMLWTFTALSDGEASLAVAAIGVPLIVLAAGAWGRFQAGASKVALTVALVAALAAGTVGWWAASRPPAAAAKVTAAGWQAWTPEREAALRAAGTPYLIDFTAAWCLTCQANKRTTLHRDEVIAALEQRGVVRLRADFTARDEHISAALAARGRVSVPTYVLNLGGTRESVLPDLLTPGIISDAIATLPRRSP